MDSKLSQIFRALRSLGWTFWAYVIAIEFVIAIFVVALILSIATLAIISITAANMLFIILILTAVKGNYF